MRNNFSSLSLFCVFLCLAQRMLVVRHKFPKFIFRAHTHSILSINHPLCMLRFHSLPFACSLPSILFFFDILFSLSQTKTFFSFLTQTILFFPSNITPLVCE